MRRLLLAVALTMMRLGAQSPARLETLGWMAGPWQGTFGRAEIEEHWLAPKGGRMLGLGLTVANGKMGSFEFLRIEERPEGLFYVAQPNGRPPVEFRLTRSSGQEATFENPRHDHPKIITYRRNADSLFARVEGDEGGKHVVQEFAFRLRK
jgi:hypothetical protein